MFRRFGMSPRAQRITLSLIALGLALLIVVLQGQGGGDALDVGPRPTDAELQAPTQTSPSATAAVDDRKPPATAQKSETAATRPRASNREQAVSQAISWLQTQEGGSHRGHTIARHVGKSNADLADRLAREDVNVASGFYDLETAAIAIVRTIRHEPNDAKVRRWLGDDENRRRLALRREFAKPIGRIVYRDGGRREGKTAIAVLTKRSTDGRASYRLLTAYVEP